MAGRKKKEVTTVVEEENVKVNNQAPVDEDPEVASKPKTGYSHGAKYIHVTDRPRSLGKVIAVMANGDRGEIIARIPGYYKIRVVGKDCVGFISSNYFKED